MPTIQQAFDEREQRPKVDELYEQWRADPTPDRMQKLVEHYRPTIEGAVKTFASRSGPVVAQRARLLAARAIKSFDPKKGASLKTHLRNHLQALQRMAPGIQDPLAPPERFRAQQMEIAHATDLMSDQLGREPTDEELAEVLKFPLKRVIKVRNRMRSRLPTSAYEEAGDEDERPDVVGSERTLYDDWEDAVYQDLGPIDRLIMMHRTGYRGAEIMTTNQIAERLKLSPSAVSQRSSRIQRRLDEFNG